MPRRTEVLCADAIDDRRRAEWAALEVRALEPNAFLSPHFVLPALRHLETGEPPLLLFVWDDEPGAPQLRGVAVLRRASPGLRFPLPHLVAYQSRHSYLSGVLVDRHGAGATLAALIEHARDELGCAGLVFRSFPLFTELAASLRAAASARGAPWLEGDRVWRPILRPAAAGPRLLEGRLGHHLKEARRQLRRLGEQAPVHWTVHKGGEGLARSMEQFLHLEVHSWKGAAGSALACRPEQAAFFREVVAGFGGEGRALFTELKAGDEVLAITSNFVSADAAFAFKISWAEAWKHVSPGVLNEVEFIRHAPEVCAGLRYVDSGSEPGCFIERLWPDRRLLAEVTIPLTRPARWSVATVSSAREVRRRARRTIAADPHDRAIVLSCQGALESPLNVIRSLGGAGVPTVLVTENPRDPAAASRHVGQVVHVPGFTRDPARLLEAIEALLRGCHDRPVLFPTADPDLLALARLRPALEARCHLLAAPTRMLETLMDKRAFARLAAELGIKVPATRVATAAAELPVIAGAVDYPVIVKPAHPRAWNSAPVRAIVGDQKAIRCADAGELLRLCQALAEHSLDFLVQDLVPGPDDHHVDLHALLDGHSEPVSWFTGQKLRLYPPHAGSGCFVRSVTVPEVIEEGLAALRRCRLTGLANVNFKRHARTGEYLMLEINPRVSQWSILAERCGVNLPLLAYQQIRGVPLAPRTPQRDDVRYANLRTDLSAFRVYHREGALSWRDYLGSLLVPGLVQQLFAIDDPGPWLAGLRAPLPPARGASSRSPARSALHVAPRLNWSHPSNPTSG